MKLTLSVLLGSLALLAGCHSHSTSRSSGNYLGEVSTNARRHKGELLASFGPVSSISKSRGVTTFKCSTVNFAYAFVVTYRGEIPGLDQGKDVHFLGRVTGSVKSINGYDGHSITVEAIAVRPQGKEAVYRVREEELATRWIEGHLDLANAQEEFPAPRNAAMAVEAPAPRRAQRYQDEAPAEMPAPLPERQPAMESYAPPPAPMPALPAAGAPRGADAADIAMIASRWNTLPEDVRAGILAQIKSVTKYTDISIISQNWTSLPGDVKARILKEVIEGGAQ